MRNIENINLLPDFFEKIRNLMPNLDLSNKKIIVATMADFLPEANELRRCLQITYDSGAMDFILKIGNDEHNITLYKKQAVNRLVNYSFMNDDIATAIIDALIASIFPKTDKSIESVNKNYDLGRQYYDQKKFDQAVYYFQQAADQGYIRAWCSLGLCYFNGTGLPKDWGQAIYWFKKSAEQGYAAAQNNLGLCYARGEGVPQDDVQAAYWYREAAEQNYGRAQCNLGNCYYSGRGVSKDLKNAAEWYRKAAENDSIVAQVNLGSCYEYGEGITRDLKMAEYWYLKAANQGNLRAQEGLRRVQSSSKNDDSEKEQIYTKLVTALKNKLNNDLQEQLLIYQLFGMSPPEEYKNIK